MGTERKLKPHELYVNPIDSRAFSTLRREDGKTVLVAEASSLGDVYLQPLFNDACDAGIAIRSHRTGVVVRFVFQREEVVDGETVAWHLVPLDDLERQRSNGVDLVTILND